MAGRGSPLSAIFASQRMSVLSDSRMGLELVLGGTAQVYCVHDREKRQVVTEAQVAALGLEVGFVYDPLQHRIHRCACCSNLFVDPSDEPRYCDTCSPAKRLVHQLGGPLAVPIGEVDA